MLDLLLIWGLRGIFGTITQENDKKKCFRYFKGSEINE